MYEQQIKSNYNTKHETIIILQKSLYNLLSLNKTKISIKRTTKIHNNVWHNSTSYLQYDLHLPLSIAIYYMNTDTANCNVNTSNYSILVPK